jgi:hypothetical protein
MRSRSIAEGVWEELDGDLCICQRPDVPHWCESCRRNIDLIASALRRARTAGAAGAGALEPSHAAHVHACEAIGAGVQRMCSAVATSRAEYRAGLQIVIGQLQDDLARALEASPEPLPGVAEAIEP